MRCEACITLQTDQHALPVLLNCLHSDRGHEDWHIAIVSLLVHVEWDDAGNMRVTNVLTGEEVEL